MKEIDMRDPKRIDRILELLGTYWHANPDLRLGQIVENMAVQQMTDPFYAEDFRIEEALVEAIAKDNKHDVTDSVQAHVHRRH
jgi:uncharacterized protein YihD (DUF1040 family)